MIKPVTQLAGWLRTRPVLGRVALYCIPDVRKRIAIREIGPLVIRLRRNRSFWLRHPLTHEGFMFAAMRRLTRPGDLAMDVGANIGMYARFWVQVFGAGRVIALEPMSENRAMLVENIRLGGIADRVDVLPLALGDTDADEALQIDRFSTGTATLDRITGGRPSETHEQYGVGAETETVHVARLDTLVSQGRVRPPAVMKIDIEGAEAMCLRGAEGVLREHRPRLAIELHGLGVAREVIGLLDGLGYYVYGYTFEDERRTYRRITPGVVDELERKYDLHHIAASASEADVRDRIEPYVPAE
ncbi:MAG: FkbM family methyltransferase [Phycisphaerae bacterium]|nr:FkbM family methyltransferase [Phycisphaerae bacterium]